MKITMRSGHVTEIDDEDAHLFEGKTVHMGTVYAVISVEGKKCSMHRIILGLVDGDPREVDHINNDPLDNRRVNLRIATPSENRQNNGGWGQYPKGISLTTNGLYQARIQKEGNRISLGSFEKLEDAVKAYNDAALELYGPNAWINHG